MKSILDSSFRYTPSAKTDIKKTFARIRRQQREQEAAQNHADAEAKSKVLTIENVRKRAASNASGRSV